MWHATGLRRDRWETSDLWQRGSKWLGASKKRIDLRQPNGLDWTPRERLQHEFDACRFLL